ncbi:hypothetical protein ACHQM5_000478 [Ranunculus cassubicifolius]
MDSMGSIQAPPIRKGKKKQAKDEVDRLKQAEKKRRRLEKALATSAAIRSELEKKKQKKKEEQQRLDEEGAAIAEAVAMHVLLGEDSDESCKIVLQNDEGLGFNPWSRASNIGLLMGGQSYTMYSLESAYQMGRKMNDWGIYSHAPEISAEIIAAQAVSSLQIAEDAHADSILINSMLRR